MAKRIAWDFCIKYPTVMLHTLSNQTAERLKELYSKTIKPLLVIVEVSDGQISQEQISILRRELMQKSVRIVFLFVSRTTNRERNIIDNTFYLPNTENLCMTTDEAQNMCERFSNRLRMLSENGEYSEDISQRIAELGLLTYEVENVDLRQPFFYGLYTYGNGFQGIAKYVEHNSQNFNSDEKKTLNVLSLNIQELRSTSAAHKKGRSYYKIAKVCFRRVYAQNIFTKVYTLCINLRLSKADQLLVRLCAL